MGFSIGRFIGSIAEPILSAFGGPIGGILGAGIGMAMTPEPAAAVAATGRATQAGPISNLGGPVNPQFAGALAPTSIAPTMASLARLPAVIRDIGTGIGLSTLPTILGGNGNGRSPISMILAKARAATGGPVTRNKIIDAAKTCGLEVAANTFGLEVREVCLVVVKGRTRRRRGVSAADIRRTKRTIHFASKVRKDLKALAR